MNRRRILQLAVTKKMQTYGVRKNGRLTPAVGTLSEQAHYTDPGFDHRIIQSESQRQENQKNHAVEEPNAKACNLRPLPITEPVITFREFRGYAEAR